MNNIAFLFTQVPHGSSAGREGLDAVLATSVFSEMLGIFFMGDGVLQLNCNQQPEKILSRNYTNAFSILEFYNIKEFFICEKSMQIRGQNPIEKRVFNVKILDNFAFHKKLATYNCILRF